MLRKHFNVVEDDAEEEYENEDKASPPATFLPGKKGDDDDEDDDDEGDSYGDDFMDNEEEIEEGGRDYLANLSNNNMRSYPENKSEILEDEGIVRPDKEKRKKISAISIAKRIARKTNM